MKAHTYAILHAPFIAGAAVDFIARNKEWLDQVRPGISAGYADKATAIKRIARVAFHTDINALLFEREGRAVAIGTTIANQTIRLQDGQLITGTDIDCWTDDDADLDNNTQQFMIGQLLNQADVVRPARAFAALKREEIGRAAGITLMRPHGRPQSITLPEGDPFNIAKSGALLQVFLDR